MRRQWHSLRRFHSYRPVKSNLFLYFAKGKSVQRIAKIWTHSKYKVASSNTHKGILWRCPPMTLQETDGSSCSVSSTTGVIPSASFTSFDWMGGDTCSACRVSALLGSSGSSFPADPGTSSEAFLSLDANRLGESCRTTLYNYNVYIYILYTQSQSQYITMYSITVITVSWCIMYHFLACMSDSAAMKYLKTLEDAWRRLKTLEDTWREEWKRWIGA